MMPIKFLTPPLSSEEIEKQKAAVATMERLLERVKHGRRYCTLTVMDRRQFLKEGYPREIANNLVFLTQRFLIQDSDKEVVQDRLVSGFTLNAFNPNYYANPKIKKTLEASHHGRCAYCESHIQSTLIDTVGHFRPKSGYRKNGDLYRPGYYFLAYEPTNLLYTCQVCDQVYKRNRFPVIGERSNAKIPIEKETPILIDPYTENPRDYIRFNPLNAYAYSFGLVKQFYKDLKGLSTEATETLLWQDPRQIPDQWDAHGNSISDAETNVKFKEWLNASHTDREDRGGETIEILGLNRPSLLHSRMAQLQYLHALYLSQRDSVKPEAEEARKLVTALASQTTNDLVEVPQYISLSIDAVHTWNHEQPPVSPPAPQAQKPTAALPGGPQQATSVPDKGVPQASTIVAIAPKKAVSADSKEVPKTPPTATPQQIAPAPSQRIVSSPIRGHYPQPGIQQFEVENADWKSLMLEDTLMYLVLESEFRMKGARRVVSLLSTDTFYGYSSGVKGVFLSIDWGKDWKNPVKVRSKYQEYETSFSELINSNPYILWSLFSNNEVWVLGDYSPLI